MTSLHSSPVPFPESDPEPSEISTEHDLSSHALPAAPSETHDASDSLDESSLSRLEIHAQKIAPDPEQETELPSHLPRELGEAQVAIEKIARSYGLDFYPVHYELVTFQEMNVVAARDGFPTRYPHWRFGQEYERLSKGYEYGVQKIYELVINNDPTIGYLMDSNSTLDQKLVMAHVCGHADFFKNNVYFAHTEKNAIDQMGNHAARIQKYMNRFGRSEVEKFMDACLSINDLIDPFSVWSRQSTTPTPAPGNADDFDDALDGISPRRFRSSSDYMDSFVNPPDVLKKEVDELRAERQAELSRFPSQPERDVLKFLVEHAPIAPWQRDVLSIIRDEAYYFLPQMQTKIMNEGWASYWHSKLLTQHVASDSDIVDYAHTNAGILMTSPTSINPYKLGVELFRDIEDRWNKGKFGPEYEQCDSQEAREKWDLKLGLGREKIFEVRRLHNDLSFISNFLTQDFCEQHKLFIFSQNDATGDYVIRSREFEKIKGQLIEQLTNHGRPILRVTDGNFRNRSELLIHHEHVGKDLDERYAQATMENLHKIWRRPVNVQTIVKDKPTILSYDGTRHTTSRA